jgi:hypothetical protein
MVCAPIHKYGPRAYAWAVVLLGHTSAVRELSENENRHRSTPFLRGLNEVFRIVDDQAASNTKLCHGIDSCFTATREGHSGQ